MPHWLITWTLWLVQLVKIIKILMDKLEELECILVTEHSSVQLKIWNNIYSLDYLFYLNQYLLMY